MSTMAATPFVRLSSTRVSAAFRSGPARATKSHTSLPALYVLTDTTELRLFERRKRIVHSDELFPDQRELPNSEFD